MPVVIAALSPLPDHRDDVVRVLGEHVAAIRAQPGCELYAVHADRRTVHVVERWTGPEDLRDHVRGPAFGALMSALEPFVAGPPSAQVVEPVLDDGSGKGAVGGAS